MPCKSLLLVLTSLFSSSALSYSGVALLSEYALSDCRTFKVPVVAVDTWAESSDRDYQCSRYGDAYKRLRDISQRGEDLLFNDLATEQVATNQCLLDQVSQFNDLLPKDQATADQLFEKTKANLARLQLLEFQKRTLELNHNKMKKSCELANALPLLSEKEKRILDDLKFPLNAGMNPACAAKKIKFDRADKTFQEALALDQSFQSEIAEIENQIEMTKESFPFAGASGIRSIREKLQDQANSVANAEFLKNSEEAPALISDPKQLATLFRSFHNNVSEQLPNVAKLKGIYSDYAKSLSLSQKSYADAKNAGQNQNIYKLDDNQKKQLFQGPAGKRFVIEALSQTNSTNQKELKNNLCRLDARYGERRETTENQVNVGIGTFMVATAIVEMSTGVGAAPGAVTAASGLSRLKRLRNLVKNSPYVGYTNVALASLSAYQGIGSAMQSCKPPLVQANECLAYSKSNALQELNLTECLTDAGMGTAGVIGLGTGIAQNTKSGHNFLAWMKDQNLEKTFLKRYANEKGIAEDFKTRTFNFDEIKSPSFSENIEQSKLRLTSGSELLKKLKASPRHAEAATDFLKTGSTSKILSLDEPEMKDVLMGLQHFTKVDAGVLELKLRKAVDAAEKARLTAQLEASKSRHRQSTLLFQNYANFAIAREMTAAVEKGLKTTEAVEKTAKAARAGAVLSKPKLDQERKQAEKPLD